MYIVRAISSHNFIIYTVTIHEKAPIFNSAKNNFRLLFIISFLIQCNVNHILTISRLFSDVLLTGKCTKYQKRMNMMHYEIFSIYRSDVDCLQPITIHVV